MECLDLRVNKEKLVDNFLVDPEKVHSYKDIKDAYQWQALRYHTDKYNDKGDGVRNEMKQRFKKIDKVCRWFGANIILC